MNDDSGSSDAAPAGPAAVEEPQPRTSGLARTALNNSALLSGSLAASWIFAFVGQVALRRVLGDERIGLVAFVESMSALAATFLTLGVDTYIRREVSVHPERARSYAATLLRLRLVLGLILSVILTFGFWAAGSDTERIYLVAIWSAGQVGLVLGQTSSAYLHAVQRVVGITLASIVAKAIWLVVVLAVLSSEIALYAAPLALLASETIRLIWAEVLIRRHIGGPQDATVGNATTVIRKSLPYYIDGLNISFNRYTVPALLGLIAVSTESGYYSTASQLMALPFFFLPVLTWVLPAVFARLSERNPAELWLATRQLCLLAAPVLGLVTAVMIAFAHPMMRLVYGRDFEPAARTFAVLSIGLPFTFLSVILSAALIANNRGWSVTRLNFVTFVGMAACAIPLILVANTSPGRASAAGAVSVACWEVITTAWFWQVARLGRPERRAAIRFALGAVIGATLLVFEMTSGQRWDVTLAALAALLLLAPSAVLPVWREGRMILRPPT